MHSSMSADDELDIMLRNHEARSQQSRVESRLQSQEVQQAASLPPWRVPHQALPEGGSQSRSSPSLPSPSPLVSVGSTLPARDSLPIANGPALPVTVGSCGGVGAPPTIHEHQAVTSYHPGIVIPTLAHQGPFLMDTEQLMTDQAVGSCIAQDEWHEPEVESEIPMITGPASADMSQFYIGTPKGGASVSGGK